MDNELYVTRRELLLLRFNVDATDLQVLRVLSRIMFGSVGGARVRPPPTHQGTPWGFIKAERRVAL